MRTSHIDTASTVLPARLEQIASGRRDQESALVVQCSLAPPATQRALVPVMLRSL
jgi:hypothetical protein